ncbi:EAL domain-containing protein [Arthrobacter sp. ISL-5]|uniref:EAL domain-containing protein n=1 Tax=Arthrobacter sp. ISL-5 TaxID=2819111 RepID=UPI001BE6D347|nr:EAL domain-containing protein [Arthrobacter sp. ISL-5]MBT2555482.1 EAL domain-containing protein [Arthrobacter sp. ISL-5]
MTKDEPESFLPAHTGAEPSPDPGGPAAPRGDMTLREQVFDVINDVLDDTCPEREWAKNQLRELLAAHPDDPERALLEHLIITRKLTEAVEDEAPSALGQFLSGSSAPEEPRTLRVPFARRSRKRIEAFLGNRMLLTAFQPIRELPDGHVTGFEALTRFVSKDGASADTWFREAAAIGLGTELEIAALQCALSAALEIPQQLFVAFNLTPETLTHTRVQELLETAHLPLERIIIELTGRAGDSVWDDLIRILTPLRHNGLRVAVDGSGPGFTPTEHVRRLRPDIIKVDRTFIESILSSRSSGDPAVIELAWEVGAVLAAEGIETEAELSAVMQAGMTAAQGYMLGRPSVHPLDWSAWTIRAETVPARTSANDTTL